MSDTYRPEDHEEPTDPMPPHLSGRSDDDALDDEIRMAEDTAAEAISGVQLQNETDPPPTDLVSDNQLGIPPATTLQPIPGSAADIDLPPSHRPGDEPSDIFSTARHRNGSDFLGGASSTKLPRRAPARNGDSDLFGEVPGLTNRDSSVFTEPQLKSEGIDFDLLASGAHSAEHSSLLDRDDDDDNDQEFIRTEPSISLSDDDFDKVSGFDEVDKDQSGSDLFGDATIVDMNLLAQGQDDRDISFLDPDDRMSAEDSSISSIFTKGAKQNGSDGGNVDMDSIPMMESSTNEATGNLLAGPDSGKHPTQGLFQSDSETNLSPPRKPKSNPTVSANLDSDTDDAWEAPDSRDFDDGLTEDGSSAADIALDAMESELDSGKRLGEKNDDDESLFSLPTPKAVVGEGVSEALNNAVAAAAVAEAQTAARLASTGATSRKLPPPRDPAITLSHRPRAIPEKRRPKWVMIAAGLLAGAGLGAAGMFALSGAFASAPTEPRPILANANPAALADKERIERELAEAQSTLTQALGDATAAKAAADALAKEKRTLESLARQLESEKNQALSEARSVQTALTTKTRDAQTATQALIAAKQALQQAESALDTVITKFKTEKLLDAGLDREAALATLPKVLQDPLIAGNSDAKVQQLLAAAETARKERDQAEERAKATAAALELAKTDAAKTIASLEETTKQFDTQLAKAREDARAGAERELARLKAERDRLAQEHQAELAAQAEHFQAQLAAARLGASVPLTNLEQQNQIRATAAFGQGMEAFTRGQYDIASQMFAQATSSHPADALHWYFLGLAHWSRGDKTAADQAFAQGAEWESRSLPNRRVVGDALVKIQGPARAALDAHRP